MSDTKFKRIRHKMDHKKYRSNDEKGAFDESILRRHTRTKYRHADKKKNTRQSASNFYGRYLLIDIPSPTRVLTTSKHQIISDAKTIIAISKIRGR